METPSNPNNSAITPPWLALMARRVLGTIDLDPASSARANKVIQARYYFNRRDDGLSRVWLPAIQRGPVSIWLNPPGGKTPDNESRARLWWNKLLEEREGRYFGHAIYLAFNIETIRLTQVGCKFSLLKFDTCVPKKRIEFHDANTGKLMRGNRYLSSITYIPGAVDHTIAFHKVFGELGQIVRAARRVYRSPLASRS